MDDRMKSMLDASSLGITLITISTQLSEVTLK